MRIAVVGGGVSGIAAARVLLRFGHEVVVYERGARPGGVWAVVYPEVRLQNVAEQYRIGDLPWPFAPDLHPTREQILRYLEAAVEHFGIDLRRRHEVVAAREEAGGWELDVKSPEGTARERFDFVVVAVGHFTGVQERIEIEGRDRFEGEVITDRDVRDLGVLSGKRIAVIGFGKSALDMASFAADRGATVHHVFRAPRWAIPKYIFGVHMSKVLFSRMSTAMIPAWVQPTEAERVLHARLRPVVDGFWSMIATVVRLETGLHGLHLDAEVRRRMRVLLPEETVPFQMRAATALAPDSYFPNVIRGRIEPYRGEPRSFGERSIHLADGREIPCDMVVVSAGFRSPSFPFLPAHHRALLESEPDGAQLYRHILHPRVARLAFAGYNHGFLHIPGVELATLWLAAYLRGDLALPPVEEMERATDEVRRWKRENVLFEPARSCGVSTRYQQYFDVLLGDLGLPPYRKRSIVREIFEGYGAGDYAGILDEYERARAGASLPRRPLPLAT